MTVEIKEAVQNTYKNVLVERNNQQEQFILCQNHTYQLNINLLKNQETHNGVGAPVVRKIKEVRILGILKSGNSIVLQPVLCEGPKLGTFEILSFVSSNWLLPNIDTTINNEQLCNLEIDYEINMKILPTQIYPIAFNIKKKKTQHLYLRNYNQNLRNYYLLGHKKYLEMLSTMLSFIV